MRRITLLSLSLSCAVVLGGFAYAAPAVADETPPTLTNASEADRRMAAFFAGVSLIRSVPALGVMERAERLRELTAASGVTVAEANAFLESCRSAPERWNVISGLVVQILMTLSDNPAAGEKTGLPIK